MSATIQIGEDAYVSLPTEIYLKAVDLIAKSNFGEAQRVVETNKLYPIAIETIAAMRQGCYIRIYPDGETNEPD